MMAPRPQDALKGIHAFQQDILEHLSVLPEICADGRIHRFDDPTGKAGNSACWYSLTIEFIPIGFYGNWRTGQKFRWTPSGSRALSAQEADVLKARLNDQRRLAEEERRTASYYAVQQARKHWKKGVNATVDHPYLQTKQVGAHNLKALGGSLLVPLQEPSGKVVNVQYIGADGRKRFVKAAPLKELYSLIGPVSHDKPLYLCEGWATGATLFEMTGAPVACAMTCHNLAPAGRILKQRYPGINLIIAGDDDRQTEGNPGRTAAIAAGIALSAPVTFPQWPEGAPITLSDFNDLACWERSHG